MKSLNTLALLLLALLLPALAVTAQDFEVDGIYYNINGNQVSVSVTYQKNSDGSSNYSYSGDITIPATVTYGGVTYTVSTIGSWAFKGCKDLTSVIIPNSVTYISDSAFEYCSGLTSVTIGNSVSVIQDYAFRGCSGLTSITLPNALRVIGNDSFMGCSGLTSISIPDSVTHIGVFAFAFCSNLTSTIVIPKTVIKIGEGLFHYCTGLPGVIVDSDNPNYDSRNDCNAIIETSSNRLVAGCKSTVIPNSVTALGYAAFSGCTGLMNIDIPNSVTHIGDYAFSLCSSLTSIAIPSSVTHIGLAAFYNCSGLDDVYSYIADPSAISMGNDVFYQDPADYVSRTLHVPEGTVDAYQADWRWYRFFGQVVADPTPTFTGGELPVIEVTPELSTGLNKIFVVYNTDGVKMNFTAATDDAVTWQRFDYSSGQLQIEELTDITRTGNITTLNHIIPNTGYRITDGSRIYYYWVVNYADYRLELNDMSFNNVDPCDLMTINVEGQGVTIPYYTVDGRRQVLDRDIKLTYYSLVWNDTNNYWLRRQFVESFAALDQGMAIVPPLCDTDFMLTGDRFLEEWGYGESLEGFYFVTQTVDCRSIVEPNDDVLIDIHGEIIGAVPLQLSFEGYPTDAVANSSWEIATDPEFENVILRQSDKDDLDYTFTKAGNYYVRYSVANVTGTCKAYGTPHTIIVNYGEHPNLPGDVNGDDEVNIADVNAVIDFIQQGDQYYSVSADVNNDGEISIADINAIIDIILGAHVAPEHEWVDLGLPSGTLWATCNVGASSPEEDGDYFAWGETAPKDNYDWSTYKWCNGSRITLTKYCNNSGYGYNGFTDSKTELDPEDDAAYVNWGPSWRMPTLEQLQELCDCCTWQWTTLNDVNGLLVIGPNENTIFLPAAGGFSSHAYWAGENGYYWSRTLCSPDKWDIANEGENSGDAYIQFFGRSRWHMWYDFRCTGCTVRAVRFAEQ